MAKPSRIVCHITTDLPGRFRQVGLVVEVLGNLVIVRCPVCTERQTYAYTDHGGWEGAAFLHDTGCAHFRQRSQAWWDAGKEVS